MWMVTSAGGLYRWISVGACQRGSACCYCHHVFSGVCSKQAHCDSFPAGHNQTSQVLLSTFHADIASAITRLNDNNVRSQLQALAVDSERKLDMAVIRTGASLLPTQH